MCGLKKYFFLAITLIWSYCPAQSDFNSLDSTLREASAIRLKLAETKRAAASERLKREELLKAYTLRIAQLESTLALAVEKNDSLYTAQKKTLDKLDSQKKSFVKFEKFCSEFIESLFADALVKKVLAKEGIKSLSSEEVAKLDCAQKYTLIKDILFTLLKADNAVEKTVGGYRSGLWLSVDISDEMLGAGIHKAKVENKFSGNEPMGGAK